MNEKTRAELINFLKSFTRLIVQSNLYSSGHPQVIEASAESKKYIESVAQSEGINELVFTLEQGRLLFNGVQLLSADRVPNSLANIYKKTACDSIVFSPEVSQKELVAFPKIISHKSSAEEFLKTFEIEKIRLIKSLYVKASKDAPGSKPQESGVNTADISKDISGKNFEESLRTIVSKLTEDPAQQKMIIDALFEKFRSEVETRINQAVEKIRKEKTRLENDYERTQAVITNIANGILTVDKDGHVIMMNPQAQAITGRPLSEIAGKKILDVANLESQIVNIANELKSPEDRKVEQNVSIKGKEDLSKTIKNSTALIKNEDGKIVGTISLPTDIAKLQELDKLKDDFISTMTHELRSPLTSIKMALDLVSRESLAPSVDNMIKTAIRNSERLNSIISDILDFSKLQSGKMTFSLMENRPEEIIKGASESMRAWSQSKQVPISVSFEENLPAVYCDKRRSEQIVINLLSNSLKFTPSGGKIEIYAYRGKDALSNFVFFSVKDSGCGIKKEEIGKIFDKFVQAASGEKAGGTGLGLAITKAMVVMQGGNITVQSEPGKGAVFTFSLPVYRETEKKEMEPAVEKTWWKKLLGI